MPLASQLPLPGEVTDAIIDHLHDDERSLRRCAVVCHSWLPGSRYHLFYTIKVRNSARAQSLAAFLAANPDIASFIQHLDLRGPPERWNHETLQFTELEGLLPLLPSIRFLSIFNMILVEPAGGQGGGAQPVTTLSLGSLVELSVEGSSNLFWGDNPLIFRLLGFFPSISRVRLLTSSHPHSVDPISTGLPANHTTIAHLATRDVPLSVVTNLVCRSRTAETLQTFWYDDHRLDWPNAGELCMFFAELCRGAKTSLHRIIFGPTDLIYPMRYKIEDDSDFMYRNPLITVPSEGVWTRLWLIPLIDLLSSYVHSSKTLFPIGPLSTSRAAPSYRSSAYGPADCWSTTSDCSPRCLRACG